ncbi:MAG: hypothetical protein Q4B22_00760 [Eubacteriales bacterium]|nr:hypothetical protein [Eubacteriales bacterium]
MSNKKEQNPEGMEKIKAWVKTPVGIAVLVLVLLVIAVAAVKLAAGRPAQEAEKQTIDTAADSSIAVQTPAEQTLQQEKGETSSTSIGGADEETGIRVTSEPSDQEKTDETAVLQEEQKPDSSTPPVNETDDAAEQSGSSNTVQTGRSADGTANMDEVDLEQFPVYGSPENPAVESEEDTASMQASEYDGMLGNTPLRLKGIRPYEGIYIEQMLDTECSNVPAAIIENTGDRLISLVQFEVIADGAAWQFEASAIPAGESVVVLEKNQAAYADTMVYPGAVTVAYGDAGMLGEKVTAAAAEEDGITITNISGETLPAIRIFYKLTADNMYLGGITYTAKLEGLEPGMEMTIYPEHYTNDNARVIMIREYEE